MAARAQVAPSGVPTPDQSSINATDKNDALRAATMDSMCMTHPVGMETPLTRYGSILAQLKRGSHWKEACSMVVQLVAESALGGALGWLVNYLFSLGNVVSGKSTKDQSYASFCASVMCITSIVLATSMLVAQAAAMLQLRFLKDPTKRPTLVSCMGLLLRGSYAAFLVSLTLTTSCAYAVASLPPSQRWLKLHFYVSGIFVNVYTVALDLGYRRIYREETVDGQTQRKRSQRSYCATLVRLTIQDAFLIFTVYVAALYIHVSCTLDLRTRAALSTFSVVSYGFKLLMQEVTKIIMLHQKKTQVRTIYLAVAVPTVLIDTQIRVMMLRQPNVNESMAGSIALAAAEILLRYTKVWLIRLEIWIREKKTSRQIAAQEQVDTGTHMPSRSHTTVTGPARSLVRWWSRGSVEAQVDDAKISTHPRYVEYMQWRRRLLRFHAAEIHADMYAEYLAIVCSMSIYYFFHDHPKYSWAPRSPNANGSANSSSLTGPRQQATYLAVQIVMEMIVDFMSCLWELMNGVPLHNFKAMRGYVTALFACCAVMNIVLSAGISINSSD